MRIESRVARIVPIAPGDTVVLDEAAIANLELVETLIGKHKKGSLLDVIDETVTAPGGRMAAWLAPVYAAVEPLTPDDVAAAVLELLRDESRAGASVDLPNRPRKSA